MVVERKAVAQLVVKRGAKVVVEGKGTVVGAEVPHVAMPSKLAGVETTVKEYPRPPAQKSTIKETDGWNVVLSFPLPMILPS